MAVVSSDFGKTELSGRDAARFIEQMNEKKPTDWLIASLVNGRKIVESVNARKQVLKNA